MYKKISWPAWLAAGLILLPVSHRSLAGIEDVADGMLGAYINATPGAVFETQRRNVATLGSASVRSRIMRPNIVNFQAPSVRGGCGGIDVFGGSFSYINADQFTQLLRNIASNASAYAFTLALEGICPTCMQKMEQLQGVVQELNGKMMDSCHWATKMVDATSLDEWHTRQLSSVNPSRDVQAFADRDWLQSVLDGATDLVSDQARGEIENVNVVWDAMKRSSMGAWFGAAGDHWFKEIVMSVTGTIIRSQTHPDTGAACTNAAGDPEYCLTQLHGTLNIHHLMDGTSGGQAVDVYQCIDTSVASDCLEIRRTTVTSGHPGLRGKVREILFGPPPGFAGGLVYKMRDKSAQLTPAEQGFIQAAPVPVYRLLSSLSAEPGLLYSAGEQISEVVAWSMARQMIMDMASAVQTALKQGNVEMDRLMAERIEARLVELRDHDMQKNHDLESQQRLMELADMLRREVAARNGDTFQIPAGRRVGE